MNDTKTITEHIRHRLLSQAGLAKPPVVIPRYTASQMLRLWDSEWIPEFERLQRNRLVMGALRYGTIVANRVRRTPYDRVGSIRRRLQFYQESGNLEHLVDIANLCMLEFDQSQHPTKHFAATDDGEHCSQKGIE